MSRLENLRQRWRDSLSVTVKDYEYALRFVDNYFAPLLLVVIIGTCFVPAVTLENLFYLMIFVFYTYVGIMYLAFHELKGRKSLNETIEQMHAKEAFT